MRPSTFSLLPMVFGAVSATAPLSTGNPSGVVYKATLREKPFFSGAAVNGPIKGSISAQAGPDGKGVKFDVNFENLPEDPSNIFTYHLHVSPVMDENCTTALGHLIPYDAPTREPNCKPDVPADCEVGDLSGKHGKVTSDPFVASYVDLYASTKENDPAFFGNRSFVLHYSNGTRLTCANFERVSTVTSQRPGHGNGTMTASSTPLPTDSAPVLAGAAGVKPWVVNSMMAGVAVMLFGL